MFTPMDTRKERIIAARVSPLAASRFAEICNATGTTPSERIRRLIELDCLAAAAEEPLDLAGHFAPLAERVARRQSEVERAYGKTGG